MAGHYYYDPRPFYGHTGYTGLIPMDELFYGRYDSTIPYWMDQRMMPFEDNYYPGHNKQMGSRRGAEVMQQQCIPQQGENNFMAYNRPELVRDDMYADMYRRSPYNFNYNYGRDAMHPGSMRQPLLRQSQDDTWVHSTSAAPATSGYGQGYRGLPEPPPGAMTTHFPNGNQQYLPMHHGGDPYRQTNIPHTMNKPSNMNNHSNSNGNSHSNSHGNNNGNSNGNSNGNGHGNGHGNNHGNSHGTKQMGMSGNQNGNASKSLAKTGTMNTTSLKRTSSNNTKHYDSSSSSDSEDERGQRSSVKSQHGQVWNAKPTHGYSSSKPSNNNNKSTSTHTHNSYGGAPKRTNSQSKISKLLGFHGRDDDDDDSSSSESDSYGSSKKRSSNNNSNTQVSKYQTQYAVQPKQTQSGSQANKPVELRVPICCDNCERKVRSCIEKMHGVETVLCDQWKRKVVVYGKVKADDVLKRVRRVKKTSEFWQQTKPQQQQQQQQQQQGFY